MKILPFKIFLFIFKIVFICNIYSQTIDSTNVYEIENCIHIEIPLSMELQSGLFKKMYENLYQLYDLKSQSVIFQQKGLNKFETESFNTYARILIKKNETDEFIENSTLKVSRKELKSLNSYIKEEMVNNFEKFNIQIIEWYPLELVEFVGFKGFKCSYKRQLSNNPIVYCELFLIPDGYNSYSFTFSYRVEDENIWADTFNKIKESIYIIN